MVLFQNAKMETYLYQRETMNSEVEVIENTFLAATSPVVHTGLKPQPIKCKSEQKLTSV